MELNYSRLVAKYNQPVPRYTSYPTVPFWKDGIDPANWKNNFSERFHMHNNVEGISLYIHLPFCESLCTYCGCNKKITTSHSVEDVYIDALEKEWNLYVSLMNEKPVIRELHLGGGTPTFFSPANLEKMMGFLFKSSILHPDHEFSIEGHPNNTTAGHLQTLFELGFRRISYGVQDHDPEVQRIINRIQPFENVENAIITARKVGFKSVNFDLIYGLPKQTIASIEKTIMQTIRLSPDRIAFYSYAHVPWTSRGQRLFDENDLPSADLKLQLYLKGKELFLEEGYADIGMDHFAQPEDDLYKAWEDGTLHRNFMGYTTQKTSLLLGLGVSSISDTGSAFAQNNKTLSGYYAAVNQNEFPVCKGYFLDEEDMRFRNYILDISCRGKTSYVPTDLQILKEFCIPELEKLAADGLITLDETGLMVSVTGRQFIRNICRAFDLLLLRDRLEKDNPIFSKAI